MHFRSKAYSTVLVLFLEISRSFAQCPGPLGDSFCLQSAGVGSFCVPGLWTCRGQPDVPCGCDFTARTGTTIPPSVTLPASDVTVPSFLTGSGRSFRFPTGQGSFTRGFQTSTTAPLSVMTTSTTLQPQTSPPIPVPSSCGSSPRQPLFVWAEWPTLNGPSDWVEYYQKMLGFVKGNCGDFAVTEIVLRVTDPTISDLWTVSLSSTIYTAFLSQLPPSVSLKLYPYLLTPSAQSVWSSVESVSTPLEGVFKYASEWNKISNGAKFSGVVVDVEEKVGFLNALPNVGQYKALYSIGTFGVALGYDNTGSAASYAGADEFFVELYDFYVNNAPSLTLVQVDSSNATPSAFVSELVNKVLGPYVSKYTDSRFKFMWSVQAKSRLDCLYPLGAGCGSKDDFGLFSGPAFNQFLQLIRDQYPVFNGRSHGIFQFSFIPVSWL